MKNLNRFTKVLMVLTLVAFAYGATAQNFSNWRPYGKTGINVFEPEKDINTVFNGLQLRLGGAFTQQFQSLSHSNNAAYDTVIYRGNPVNGNELYALAPGFNLATANLYLDAQLADGIRLTLENYMSSRHHVEFWVKGGYIQIDKLPMFDNTEWFTKYARVKIGHFQVNYGDQQFRRSDNGNAMYNPFVGNYIMDAFTTEIGAEIYYFTPKDVMLMFGLTSGYINGNIQESDNRSPSVYAKIAYDKQINTDLRFRLAGSVYANSNAGRNTIYAGDRAGSRFYLTMDPAYYVPRGSSDYTTASAGDLFTSGRVNPGFSNNVTTFQINPFIKFKEFEFFGTIEQAQGYSSFDPIFNGSDDPEKRSVTQIGVEGIYRFHTNEQLFIGARYNSLTGEMNAGISENEQFTDLTVNRFELAAGWFPINNLQLKAAYVNQEYKDFPSTNILSEGEFSGIVIEAIAAF